MTNEIHSPLPAKNPPGVSPARLSPVFLAGPTAAGKSAVALALAERLGGEIISVDSMQVYRGMDIGTAKPGPAELQRARHHLIDVAGLDETFDAARFVRLAAAAAAEIQSRGHVPIFCGGTGFYFKATGKALATRRRRTQRCGPNWRPGLCRNCWPNWRKPIRPPSNGWTAGIRAASSARSR